MSSLGGRTSAAVRVVSGMTYSPHILALVFAMATPMRCGFRSDADRHAIDVGMAAGLFELVPLSTCPSHTMLKKEKDEFGVQLTADGRQLARKMKLVLNVLLEPNERVPHRM